MSSVFIIDNTGNISSAMGELAVDGVFEDEVQAVTLLEDGAPAIILLHYAIRETGTAELIRILRQLNSAIEIIVIGDQLPEAQIIPCLLAGAKGYQNMATLALYVNTLITVIAAGEAWVSRKMTASLINYWRSLAL